jgi:hypothetical protein
MFFHPILQLVALINIDVHPIQTHTKMTRFFLVMLNPVNLHQTIDNGFVRSGFKLHDSKTWQDKQNWHIRDSMISYKIVSYKLYLVV